MEKVIILSKEGNGIPIYRNRTGHQTHMTWKFWQEYLMESLLTQIENQNKIMKVIITNSKCNLVQSPIDKYL